jgi:acetyl esterase/lipase
MTEALTFTYKRAGSLELKAAVHVAASEGPRPVVVWIHGGALINGHRDSVMPWMKAALLPRGHAIVSVDYRLAPETRLPEIIADIEDALRWVRERGPALFRADPRRVVVAGGSAGGYLALTTGFRVQPRPTAIVALWGYGDLVGDWYSTPSPHPRHHQSKLSRDEAYRQVAGPPVADQRQRSGDGYAFYQFCRQQGIWPQAVSGWDPHREERNFVPFMPERNVTAAFPPTLLIHGEADTDVPYERSLTMARLLQEHGVEHRLIGLPGAEHGLAGADQKAIDAAYAAAAEFITRHC